MQYEMQSRPFGRSASGDVAAAASSAGDGSTNLSTTRTGIRMTFPPSRMCGSFPVFTQP